MAHYQNVKIAKKSLTKNWMLNKLYFISLLSVALMLSHQTKAQTPVTSSPDWTPFPANQKTWFEFGNETFELSALYYATNVRQQGDQIQYYLDGNNTVGQLGEIGEDCRINYNDLTQNFVDVLEPITEQDGLHYFHGQLVFNTNLTVGEGFFVQSENYTDFDEVYIECLEQRIKNVLGQIDEVKEFSLQAYANGQPVNSALDNFSYLLSKSFGFIQFLPFTELLNEPKTTAILNGFVNAEGNLVGNKGDQFIPPYEVGDVIYYSDIRWYSNISTKNWRDSITAVTVYEDSLIYTFNRLEINKQEERLPPPFNTTTIDTLQSNANQQTYYFNTSVNSPIYKGIYGYYLNNTFFGYITMKQNSFSFNNQIETTFKLSHPSVSTIDGCIGYPPPFISRSSYHSALGKISTFYQDDCCITERWSLDVYKKGDQVYAPFVQLNPVYNIADSPVKLINAYHTGSDYEITGPAIEDGIFYPAFLPDSLLNQPIEITLKLGLYEVKQTITVNGSREGQNEIDFIFYDNFWLTNYVNPWNCNEETFQVFGTGNPKFIYIIDHVGNGTLFYDAKIYCEDSLENRTCLAEHFLFNPNFTWLCNNAPLIWGCIDASACNYVPSAEADDNSCRYDCVEYLVECPTLNEVSTVCAPVNPPSAFDNTRSMIGIDNDALRFLTLRFDEQTNIQRYFTTTARTYTFTDNYGDQKVCSFTYHVANQFLQAPEVAEPGVVCEEDLWSYIKIGIDQYKIYADDNGRKGEEISTCNTPGLICSTTDFGVDTEMPDRYNFWATTYFEFPDGSICESEATPFYVEVQAKPEATLSVSNKTMLVGEGMPLMDIVASNRSGYWSGENIIYLMTDSGENIAYFTANSEGAYKLYYTVKNDFCERSYLMIINVEDNAFDNCNTHTGTFFYADCGGINYYFIELDDGRIFDPYFAVDPGYYPYEGQRIHFDYEIKTDVSTPCDISESPITIICFETINDNCIVDDPFSLPIIQHSVDQYHIGPYNFLCVYTDKIIQFEYEGSTYFRVDPIGTPVPFCPSYHDRERFYNCQGEFIGGGRWGFLDCLDIDFCNSIADASNEGEVIWSFEIDQDCSTEDPFSLTFIQDAINQELYINNFGDSCNYINSILQFQYESYTYFRFNATAGISCGPLYGDAIYNCRGIRVGGAGVVNASDAGTIIWSSDEGYAKQETNHSFDLSKNTSFNIYPNPTTDKVFIDLPGKAVYQINLTDISGKVMKQLETKIDESIKEIGVNDLPKGIYLVKLKSELSSSIKKLVVE